MREILHNLVVRISVNRRHQSLVDAERFVLGSILLDDSFFIQTASSLEMDDFSLEMHRRIFKRMGELSERGERIDRVTVANELMRHSELESCGGLAYLAELTDTSFHSPQELRRVLGFPVIGHVHVLQPDDEAAMRLRPPHIDELLA